LEIQVLQKSNNTLVNVKLQKKNIFIYGKLQFWVIQKKKIQMKNNIIMNHILLLMNNEKKTPKVTVLQYHNI